MRKVLYLSLGTEEAYDILRRAMSPGYSLVTLAENSDAECRAKIQDAEVVIVGAISLTGELIAAARNLRLVHHQGVGYQDTVDIAALSARGIPLALAPEGTTTVAEHTVLLILATLRRLSYADSELRAGRWHIASLRPVSRTLAGSTIGYIGMGRIGKAVAERLKSFDTRGLYFNTVSLSPRQESELNIRAAPLADVLSEADIVTLHVPATSATRHLIDAQALARMKPGSFLVNTARGCLVDEGALYSALVSGRIAGAGMDVFETEPPFGSPLLALPNVVVTPHIAAGTRDALTEKTRAIFANIDRFFRGEPLNNTVALQRVLRLGRTQILDH